jgi:hypothetical protein
LKPKPNGAETAAGVDAHDRLMQGGEGVYPELDVLETPPPRENFIPIARFALIDRLTDSKAWPDGGAAEARRFFKYLDYWRHQQYSARLFELGQDYEVFSPDSDLLQTREYTDQERRDQQRRVVEGVEQLLVRANFSRIDPSHVETILSKETHYGLDLSVDLRDFEELLIYYRGASNKTQERRRLVRFMRKEEFEVPTFRRLFVLFKLKPFERRVQEVMERLRLDRKNAEKHVRRLRAMLPADISEDNIYLKLFKNMPRSDIEMAFPNTRIRFRMVDKLKLGVTSGAGVGMSIAGLAGKITVLANPITAIPALAGLGGVAFRQFMSFMNQRQRYMVIMAQNLYFHALADNRSAILTLADRAAQEDIKEDLLLYTVLAKESVNRGELKQVDEAIEKYLLDTFGIHVDFDVQEALGRLLDDGMVVEEADGTLRALPPREAALLLDQKWDVVLDLIPDVKPHEGRERELPGADDKF